MLFPNYFIENAEIRTAAEIIHIPNCRDSDGAERIPTPNSRRYLDGGGRNL